MKAQSNRIPSLDGIRALSITLVVFNHIWISNSFQDKFYLFGNLGVRIFFVISGFLITSILINELGKTSKINLKKFYLRRTFRIFPAYYFYIAVIYYFSVVFNLCPENGFLITLTYTTNYFFTQVPRELGHFWSLAVEEQFYLIFPGLLALVGLSEFKKVLLALLFLTPALRYISVVYSQTSPETLLLQVGWYFHNNVDVIATGCLLAIWRNSFHQNKVYQHFLRLWFSPIFFISLIILLGYYSEKNLTLFYLFGITLMNLSIAFCIDWFITNPKSLAGKFLNLRPIQYVGVLSYSIYLWQQPFTFYSPDKVWTHFPYNFILLILCSLFSYYIIEETFLKYRQNIEKQLFTEKPKEKNILPQPLDNN